MHAAKGGEGSAKCVHGRGGHQMHAGGGGRGFVAFSAHCAFWPLKEP